MSDASTSVEVATFCPLCVSRCGARATVANGTFTLNRDPSHPTGKVLCIKGKEAPAITAHPDRLRHPMMRTTPKGSDDPGWQRVTWDEALTAVADRLQSIARDHGPESVVFSSVSPSTSAIVDCVDWIQRLQRAFGSPNLVASMELCGWGRYLASLYTFGASVPGQYMPDLERAECILFWGYNPAVSRLAHATATRAALLRGAKLIVVDPRRAGLASKADRWLRVRPGTDAALALAITNVMIERGWYDDEFVRRWTSAPLLVRGDTGRLLRASDLPGDRRGAGHVAWDMVEGQPVVLDPGGGGGVDAARLALDGTIEVPTTDGPIPCRPVFDLLAEQGRTVPPAVAEEITGVPVADIEATARMVWEHRPLAFYTWSGLEQHSGTTQIIRAINVLYALTGCIDAPGGNVLFTPVPTNPIAGQELLDDAQAAKAIGLSARPLGPARFGHVTGEDFYRAAIDGDPYRARGLVSFGSNLLMAHGDSTRGRAALQSLDFHVHLDQFMSPTAEQADVVLPVTGAFESEGLKVGFEVSQEAQSLVQLRTPLVPRVGEARPDIEVIFDLACRLGLGEHFFGGDVDAGWRFHLAPSGITLDRLRADPAGVRLPLETRHQKYATTGGENGRPAGFATPTGRVELYVEQFLDVEQPPLPTFTEPALSPRAPAETAGEFPLVLTCSKALHFCETQHRQVASLRRHVPDPTVELHPDTAAERGISEGGWVEISTPLGTVRARAELNDTLDPGVVSGQHGWYEPCEELDLPGFPPFGPGSANLNLVLAQTPSDPVSGSSPLRAQACQIVALT